ncbi:MAG: hypothetical protein HYW48_06260 [Deltaproteobacteria bacterium]|nr:hypothetical protein [Deltaproteobacteria bacterium]
MKLILKSLVIGLLSTPAFADVWKKDCQLELHGNGHGFEKGGEPVVPPPSGNGPTGNSTTKEPKKG